MKTIYTIGYEGTDIDKLVATLRAVGIETLVDVRAVALSRKRGFSKTALKTRLELEGIKYLHLSGLGDPKPGREAARAGRMQEFKSIYKKHLRSPEAESAMEVLTTTVKSGASCLLCFERDPTVCHRSIVSEKLKKSGFGVLDLFGDNPAAYVKHASKLPRHGTHQGLTAA